MLELLAAAAFGGAVGYFTRETVLRWKTFRRSVLPDLVWRVIRDPRGGRIWQFGRNPPKITRTQSLHFVEIVRLPAGSLEAAAMAGIVETMREPILTGGLRVVHFRLRVALGRFGLLKIDSYGVAKARGR